MAIQITSTRNALATAYAGIGAHVGLCTASPGTSTTPANEATGGGYARVATTWGSASGGSCSGGQVTITAAAATYTHGVLCVSINGNQFDWAAFGTAIVLSAAGQILVTPSITIS